jgi:hypothetical protein
MGVKRKYNVSFESYRHHATIRRVAVAAGSPYRRRSRRSRVSGPAFFFPRYSPAAVDGWQVPR